MEEILKKGRTGRSSEPEPADWPRDKSNVIGGWLPSLTCTFDGERTLAGFEKQRTQTDSIVCLLGTSGCS